MGEMADDLILGRCCTECFAYFEGEEGHEDELYKHGYPVVCKECWESMSDEDKEDKQEAIADTI